MTGTVRPNIAKLPKLAMSAAARRLIAAPTMVEASPVILPRKGPQGDIALSALLRSLAIEVVPMTSEAAELARSAYARYDNGVEVVA